MTNASPHSWWTSSSLLCYSICSEDWTPFLLLRVLQRFLTSWGVLTFLQTIVRAMTLFPFCWSRCCLRLLLYLHTHSITVSDIIFLFCCHLELLSSWHTMTKNYVWRRRCVVACLEPYTQRSHATLFRDTISQLLCFLMRCHISTSWHWQHYFLI